MKSFVFDPTKETPESVKRRSLIAQQMAAKVGTPRNVGEGLSAIGAGIAGYMQNKRAKAGETAGQESATNAFAPVLAAMTGQQAQSPAGLSIAPQQASTPLPPMPMSGGNSPAPTAYVNDRVSGAFGDFDRDALHKSQLMAESGGDPNAVSPAGAQGLMQIMPETAKQPGFGLQPLQNPMDPVANEQFGRQYMDKMLERYQDDPKRALAAYNWGAGNADKWNGDESTLPAETRNYIAKIMAGSGGAQNAINQQMPQGGQMPQQQAGMGLPELMKAAQNPWLNEGQRSVINAMMEQQFKAMQPQDPLKALQMQKLEQEINAKPKRDIIKAADGFNYYQDTGERVLPNVSAAPDEPKLHDLYDEQTGQPYKARFNPQTGEFERVGGIKAGSNGITITNPDGTTTQIGGSNKPATEGQAKANTFATRMEKSNALLDTLEGEGTEFGNALISQAPLVGNYFVTPEFRRYKQAKDDFINAALRQESGAAIGKDEYAAADTQYFPQPGDDAKTIEQKRQNRITALTTIRQGSGPFAGNGSQSTPNVDFSKMSDEELEAIANGQ